MSDTMREHARAEAAMDRRLLSSGSGPRSWGAAAEEEDWWGSASTSWKALMIPAMAWWVLSFMCESEGNGSAAEAARESGWGKESDMIRAQRQCF